MSRPTEYTEELIQDIAIAQTSLAEILLRLNVGLVGIITSFVNGEKNDVQVDFHHLTDLSERCRVDTCRTLRQLFKRITQLRQPLAIMAPENFESRRSVDTESDVKKDKKGTAGYTKVRGPMIAKVIIQDSSKAPQIAIVKPGERRKKSTSTSSSGSNSSSVSKARSEPSLLLATPPPEYTPVDRARPKSQRTKTAPGTSKQSRDPTVTPTPSPRREMRAARSASHLANTLQHMPEPLPSMPELDGFPVSLGPALPRRRKQTPTYYSIASDSTKLGEIPLHKWNVPYDFDAMSVANKQALRNGWPANQVQNERKRFGLFRIFGRRRE